MVKSYLVTSDHKNINIASRWANQHGLHYIENIAQYNIDNIYIEFIDNNLLASFYDQGQKISVIIGFLELQQRAKKSPFKESIVKAIGEIKPGYQLYDLTAGFARDSFILASYGYDIILLEKHPVIYALTKYSIEQLSGSRIGGRMKIIHQDAIEFLDNLAPGNFVFYLDPMFIGDKRSKAKKTMQILQKINPPDLDVEILLKKSLAKGKKVILKRPINSRPLINDQIHHIITGSKIKFEIYLGKG